jgi:hypothetical protein
MALKRPAVDTNLAPDENPVSEQSAAVGAAAVAISSSSSEVSDDAALSPAEANADEFSDDGCSTGADADAPTSTLQRAATDPRTVSVVTEPLKRDHRLLLLCCCCCCGVLRNGVAGSDLCGRRTTATFSLKRTR